MAGVLAGKVLSGIQQQFLVEVQADRQDIIFELFIYSVIFFKVLPLNLSFLFDFWML